MLVLYKNIFKMIYYLPDNRKNWLATFISFAANCKVNDFVSSTNKKSKVKLKVYIYVSNA